MARTGSTIHVTSGVGPPTAIPVNLGDMYINTATGSIYTANKLDGDLSDWKIDAVASGTVDWGDILGTLTDQTDLADALNLKVDTATLALVATSGNYNDLTNKPDLSALNDVSIHADLASFPGTGDSDSVYIAEDSGFMYRWNGAGYTQLTDQTAIWGQISGTLGNQADLVAALAGKANTSHTHAISEIINLQTELDGKANTVHTHTVAQVDGLQTQLDGKVDDSQVQTNVPPGAVFTDTQLTDGEVETAYGNQVPVVSQGNAEAGVSTTVYRWTPQRIAQAIAALAAGGGLQNNFIATTDPGVSDDTNAGYSIGSVWINTSTDEAYRCVDAAAGAAVWVNTSLTSAELATVGLTGEYDDLLNKPDLSVYDTLPNQTTLASDTTPNPVGSARRNEYTLTNLAGNATFAAPSGSPADGNKLLITIDSTSTRTLAWNAIYSGMAEVLPTSKIAGKTMLIGFRYNAGKSSWQMIALNEQA